MLRKVGEYVCQYYKIGAFARLLGVSTGTLRDYDKKGILKPHHTSPYGYRYYSHEQYEQFLSRHGNVQAGIRDVT